MDQEKSLIIIKKKKHVRHQGHHGGAWKVAYADFVTAMMAFFMVMWIMGSDEETKKSVESYFKGETLARDSVNANGTFNGGDTSRRLDGAQGRFEEKQLESPHYTPPVYAEEYEALKDLADSYEGAAFTKDAETEAKFVQFEIAKRLNFKYGTVDIPKDIETRQHLFRLAQVFNQHDGSVVIEGFADGEQDWAIAFGRAMAVRRFLASTGEVNPDKLIPRAGFNLPADGHVADLQEKNRGTVRFILKRQRPN